MLQNKRLGELDALRGLAALSVMLFHYTTFYGKVYGHRENFIFNVPYGYFGVHLFFIISGYVIYMTLEKCANVKEFITKRAIRLYPAYIMAVLLTFTATSLYSLSNLKVSIRDFLFNMTMFQGVLPTSPIKPVDAVYWSLGIELTFYIGCCLFLVTRLNKFPTLLTSIWLSGIFLIKFLYFHKLITPIIGDLGIINYSNLFIAGIMFYQLKKSNFIYNHIIILLSLLFEFYVYGITYGVLVTIFYLIFYLFVFGKLTFLNTNSLVFLGTISFSLYLIHSSIGYIIINILEKHGFTNEIFTLIPIMISIGLATVITFYIEKPIQKLIKNKLNRKVLSNNNEILIKAEG